MLIKSVSSLREHVVEEENTTNTGREDGERTSKLLMHRYNYTLSRCFHSNKVKLFQEGHNFSVLCLDCRQRIFKWTKYSDDIVNITQIIAESMFVIGKPTELTEEERIKGV